VRAKGCVYFYRNWVAIVGLGQKERGAAVKKAALRLPHSDLHPVRTINSNQHPRPFDISVCTPRFFSTAFETQKRFPSFLLSHPHPLLIPSPLTLISSSNGYTGYEHSLLNRSCFPSPTLPPSTSSNDGSNRLRISC